MARVLLLWVFLGAALVGLVMLELHLERRESSAREARDRIGRLIPADERNQLAVSMIRVAPFQGPAHLFAQVRGVWRCPSQFNAVASEEAITALLKSLLEAEGVVQSRGSERATEYGLDREESVSVALLGAQGEVQLQVDLGLRLEDLGGCYVRRADHPGIWSIDTDPWQALGVDPTGRRPPLLDPHVIPRVWPGKSRKVDRVVIETAQGTRLEVTLEEIEISEEEVRSGKLPYIWHLTVDGEPSETSTQNVMQYTSFLLKIPFLRALDPGQAQALWLAEGAPRVILFPAEGEPAELRLGPARSTDGAGGASGVLLANLQMNTLFEVAPEVGRLLIPDRKWLEAEASGSPWDAWLRAK